jgi:hypothetical protein
MFFWPDTLLTLYNSVILNLTISMHGSKLVWGYEITECEAASHLMDFCKDNQYFMGLAYEIVCERAECRSGVLFSQFTPWLTSCCLFLVCRFWG